MYEKLKLRLPWYLCSLSPFKNTSFAFDWIVSASILLNHDFSVFYPYLINGLLFDVFHALGNAVFVVLLANPLGELMSRHRTVNRGFAVSEVVTS